MAPKTLNFPITLGTQVAQQADGSKVAVEIYADQDGHVRVRGVDPPQVPDRMPPGSPIMQAP